LVLLGEEGYVEHLEEDKSILNGLDVSIMNIDNFLGSIKHCKMEILN